MINYEYFLKTLITLYEPNTQLKECLLKVTLPHTNAKKGRGFVKSLKQYLQEEKGGKRIWFVSPKLLCM